MRWDTYEPDIVKQVSLAPGGTALAGALIERLELQDGINVLDLDPGPGVVAAVVAKEYGVKVTCIVDDSGSESALEDKAKVLGAADLVRVIPGKITEIPTPSEEFQSVYCLGHPFFPSPKSALARELYRVLAPDGVIAFAGPASLTNYTPDHMKNAFDGYGDIVLRTPAYTALLFAREGFHILTAEFMAGAWDHWMAWLEDDSGEFRKAALEDGGRWLSLGLIVLKKPPKPKWAV